MTYAGNVCVARGENVALTGLDLLYDLLFTKMSPLQGLTYFMIYCLQKCRPYRA